jgi:hypothetical protein
LPDASDAKKHKSGRKNTRGAAAAAASSGAEAAAADGGKTVLLERKQQAQVDQLLKLLHSNPAMKDVLKEKLRKIGEA